MTKERRQRGKGGRGERERRKKVSERKRNYLACMRMARAGRPEKQEAGGGGKYRRLCSLSVLRAPPIVLRLTVLPPDLKKG